jgi:F0F1-type ATP synthase delta subunit
MKTPRTSIASLLAERSLEQASSKKLSHQMAAYLLEEGRVNELDSILRDVQADWAEAGVVEVIASSARPLMAEVKNDIKARVRQVYPKAKQVIISNIIDSDVVGGGRLSLPGQQLDMSVEAKLNKFKQLTLNGSAGSGKD